MGGGGIGEEEKRVGMGQVAEGGFHFFTNAVAGTRHAWHQAMDMTTPPRRSVGTSLASILATDEVSCS